MDLPVPEQEEVQKSISRLAKVLEHPTRFVKAGGRIGAQSTSRFMLLLGLFGALNTLGLIVAIYRLFSTGFGFGKLLVVILVLAMGVAFTVFAAIRAYQYVQIRAMAMLYKEMAVVLRKVADQLVDWLSQRFQGQTQLMEQGLSKANMVQDLLRSGSLKFPKPVKKAVVFLLNRVPLTQMVLSVKEEVLQGRKTEAGVKLYKRFDEHIANVVLKENTTNWLRWLLPLNIALLVLLIAFGIG